MFKKKMVNTNKLYFLNRKAKQSAQVKPIDGPNTLILKQKVQNMPMTLKTIQGSLPLIYWKMVGGLHVLDVQNKFLPMICQTHTKVFQKMEAYIVMGV